MSDKRPTKEQLQTALAAAEQSRPPRYVAVLAVEVRALQRDLEDLSEAAKLRIVQLQDEVKILCAVRDDAEARSNRLQDTLAVVTNLCDRALRGEP